MGGHQVRAGARDGDGTGTTTKRYGDWQRLLGRKYRDQEQLMPTPRRLLVYYVAGLAIILAMVVWTYVKQDIDSDVDLAAWRHANMAIAPAEVDPKAYFAQSESAFKLFVGCLCLLIVYLTVGVTVSITLALGAKDRRPTGRSEFP